MTEKMSVSHRHTVSHTTRHKTRSLDTISTWEKHGTQFCILYVCNFFSKEIHTCLPDTRQITLVFCRIIFPTFQILFTTKRLHAFHTKNHVQNYTNVHYTIPSKIDTNYTYCRHTDMQDNFLNTHNEGYR